MNIAKKARRKSWNEPTVHRPGPGDVIELRQTSRRGRFVFSVVTLLSVPEIVSGEPLPDVWLVDTMELGVVVISAQTCWVIVRTK